jgi:hypothetical protein
MKTLLIVFLLLAGFASAKCQQPAAVEEAVGRVINSGLLEGHDQKVIAGRGDSVAVLVTKVVGDGKLTTGQIDSALVILNSAFAEVNQDIEPRTTLFVLEHLKLLTTDPTVQRRIDTTRQYVLEQVLAYKQHSRQ